MSLRQGLILAINTSTLLILFVFMSWLYRESRHEARAAAKAALERSAAVSAELAALRERELKTLAASLSAGPMLRAALSTGDSATIKDVLASIREKNGLTEVILPQRGKSVAIAKGLLCGWGGDPTLVVCRAPDTALLDEWTRVTGVRYRLRNPKGSVVAANLDAAAEAALAGRSFGAEIMEIDAGGARYSALARPMLGGLSAEMLADQSPFWAAFQRRRNALIVIGAALFFLGLLLSIALAELLARNAPRETGDADWKRLLDEIEAARGKG